MSRLDYCDVSSIMLEDARHDECIAPKLSTIKSTREALGSEDRGLGVACVYCLPALVTAHTHHHFSGYPCCNDCVGTDRKPNVPSFVLREYF